MMTQRLRQIAACFAVLTMLVGAFPAAAQEKQSRNASWFYPVLNAEGSQMHLLTDAQLDVLAALPSEEVHDIVEALFLAAAGTEEREELTLWKRLKSSSEKEARSLENAAYRAKTLLWLQMAFQPGNRIDTAEDAEISRPAPTPVPANTAPQTVQPSETASLPEAAVWQPADGEEALASNVHGQNYLKLLVPLGGSGAETCVAVTQAVVQRWLAEIEHERLRDINGHYQLWLYAPGTPIDYPVVQCGNNSYYLDRMFNRRSNPSGTLFVDYRNLKDFDDPNTLIYGHHMRDGSMFHSLTDYDAAGYYEAHPYMLAVSAEEIHIIEVFAGYVTDSRDQCYDIAISDEEDMRAFVTAAKRKSDFFSPVEISCGRDHLVTLSTCAYNFDNARCVVLGRLLRVWENQPAVVTH